MVVLKSRIAVYQSLMTNMDNEKYIYVNVFVTKSFCDNKLNKERAVVETAKMAYFRINNVIDDGFSATYTKNNVWGKNRLFSALQRYAEDHNMEIAFHSFND